MNQEHMDFNEAVKDLISIFINSKVHYAYMAWRINRDNQHTLIFDKDKILFIEEHLHDEEKTRTYDILNMELDVLFEMRKRIVAFAEYVDEVIIDDKERKAQGEKGSLS